MDKKTLGLIEAALKKRAPLLKITNALRLINGAGDALPGLVLEQYNRHYVCHLFDKKWLDKKDGLAAFIRVRLSAQFLIVKERLSPDAIKTETINASILINEALSQTMVVENNFRFGVDLNDGLNSGLFLDMRANRRIVAGHAKGRKVFNGFAYTCSFGVACRAAGASSVVNVDISRKALERGAANYKLNGLVAGESEFARAEAAFYLERAAKKDNRFDLIILDPPSFARHGGEAFSVKKDLPALVALAMNVLNAGGIIFVATNYSGLSPRQLESLVRAKAGKRVKSIELLGQDVDFLGSGKVPESYLAAVLVKTV